MTTIKSCNLPKTVATQLLISLNPGNIKFCDQDHRLYLVTTDLERLVFPEGWYYDYAHGYFTNKRTSTTEFYAEVPLYMVDEITWRRCN